jgi:hypothetical protein
LPAAPRLALRDWPVRWMVGGCAAKHSQACKSKTRMQCVRLSSDATAMWRATDGGKR